MVGTKGMFTKEIEEALADGRVDLAVHSLKDLPTDLPPGFELVAVTKRVNPRDVFLSVKYDSVRALPQGARVGTSSLRRQAQLKVSRPDLEIYPLRGNVDTRVRKLEEGEYDAIILAAAGLTRLGKTQLVKEIVCRKTSCVRRRDRERWASRFAKATPRCASTWRSWTTQRRAPRPPASALC